MAAPSSGTPTAVNPRGVEASVPLPRDEGPRENGQDRATASPSAPGLPQTLEEYLFAEGYAFDFFQAVRILERLAPERRPVGRGGPPRQEVVRFRAYQSLSFPPSSIYELARPAPQLPVPVMIVSFMGLTGPSGVLPRHYTELILRLQREADEQEKYALRDWFDLFNHRLISLFFRAWEKYRFYIPYERSRYGQTVQVEEGRAELDDFTRCLFSLAGLGVPTLRNRLRVSCWEEKDGLKQERVLAQVDDLILLHYSGFLAQRTRNTVGLEALLQEYFQLAVRVRQFQGQWLRLGPENQSRVGSGAGNNQLGVNIVTGERVWDVQSKFRIRIGPLRYGQFSELLPDRTPVPERKTFFLLAHLVRFYVGPEFDFDVQLVLQAAEIPECQLAEGANFSPRLGWNTWISSQPFTQDAEEAVFEGEEVRWLKK
jgi:type VI secretion system protein ImpH